MNLYPLLTVFLCGCLSYHSPRMGMGCPPRRPIKGNRESKIYHMPGDAFYEQTSPERCFRTETEAQKAGYRKAER